MRFKRNTKLTLVFWGCATSLFLAALTAYPLDAAGETASFYGGSDGLDGNPTASGQIFDSTALTAASRTYPFGTRLLVKHEGRGVVVEVNDLGPFVQGRDLDLSKGAAEKIGLDGVGEVEVSEVPSSTSEKLPDTSGAPTS